MSERGAQIEVLINGETVGSWSGDTRTYVAKPHPVMGPLMIKDAEERIDSWPIVYADVKIPLIYGKKSVIEDTSGKEFAHNGNTGEIVPAELAIRLSGDVKMCYFTLF